MSNEISKAILWSVLTHLKKDWLTMDKEHRQTIDHCIDDVQKVLVILYDRELLSNG